MARLIATITSDDRTVPASTPNPGKNQWRYLPVATTSTPTAMHMTTATFHRMNQPPMGPR